MPRHRRNPRRIIRDTVGAVLVGPYVDAHDPASPVASLEPPHSCGLPLTVEAHPVDHRPVLDQAEQARALVPCLRPRCHRADLDEAEAEAEHLAVNLGILVEPCGKADRIGEVEPRDAHRERGIAVGGPPRRKQLQRGDRGAMRPLRVEREGERPDEGIERHRPLLSLRAQRSNPVPCWIAASLRSSR